MNTRKNASAMIRKCILTSCALAYLLDNNNTHVHSFQLQGHPKTKRNLFIQRNIGFINDPRDVKPNAKKMEIISSESHSNKSTLTTLNPFESAWTKYGMIAYVAHMCAFLPFSLLPTYLQTKLGLLSKSESEHQALQVGQKCAQRLLQWIPFMNVGESI